MRVLPVIVALLATACVTGPSAPPPELGADRFYAQYVDAGGLPVLASARVRPDALTSTVAIVSAMLDHRPDLRAHLARQDYRLAVLAESEGLLDLPEFAGWTRPAKDDPRLTRCEIIHYDARIGGLTDREYWHARVRGIGGQRTVVAEEDVLGLASSRYYGETIAVHEFAHNILYAIEAVDPALHARIEAAYRSALANDLWFNEYAITTLHEYWAEGTQFWFNSNRLVVVDGRRILDHHDLAAYDPALYRVLGEAYGPGHALPGDPFHLSPARVPPGPIPENTAEVC